MHRRHFLRTATSAAGAALCRAAEGRHSAPTLVALVVDQSAGCTSSPGARWAIARLKRNLEESGLTVNERPAITADSLSILVATSKSPSARALLQEARIVLPQVPESFIVFEVTRTNSRVLVACAHDERGITYALDGIAARLHRPSQQTAPAIAGSPANSVRSVMRQFTSELLDKPWFYDREGWQRYLDLLAANRWNRLNLTFGLGYDSLKRVDDSYLLFFYPFVVSVPGYRVYATNLPDAERDRNLQTLQFMSEQTAARGMEFELGIWMHGYQWSAGRARNKIEGLAAETHAPYCRDALTLVLKSCPAVSSVGLRIHGESGVAEGSYDFWATIFDGVKRCGRKVEIDLHAKGIDERMIENALATGMPVNLSPKYSAEHFAMPYHQASIREIEMPVPGHSGAGLMTLSEGSRVFTRYGYADLLKEDRQYTVRYRVFAGTQRILLWADPVSTAAYAAAFQFCGATGVDLMEPLTCRGRRGSALPGTRTGYAAASLEPKRDWEKYVSWYEVWGRLLYDPGTASEPTEPTYLQHALANASRILPIVTNAYLPSAACDAYWPEIYWNQPMAAEPKNNPYTDTLAPKVFSNASPLDPQLFATMNEHAQELLDGKIGGTYSPIDVAHWLDTFAAAAEQHLSAAGDSHAPAARRTIIDVKLQIGLGRFFAAKFRAGVLYAVYEKTNDRRALERCLEQYRAARNFWAKLAGLSGHVYASDLSVSDRFDERGQWRDRLADIDADVSALDQKLPSAGSIANVEGIIYDIFRPQPRATLQCQHEAPARFRRADPITLTIKADESQPIETATLHYRRVNQAERFQSLIMESEGNHFYAQIPGAYTESPYPLQYYFELRSSPRSVSLYPGFAPDLTNQPYFLVRQTRL